MPRHRYDSEMFAIKQLFLKHVIYRRDVFLRIKDTKLKINSAISIITRKNVNLLELLITLILTRNNLRTNENRKVH